MIRQVFQSLEPRLWTLRSRNLRQNMLRPRGYAFLQQYQHTPTVNVVDDFVFARVDVLNRSF